MELGTVHLTTFWRGLRNPSEIQEWTTRAQHGPQGLSLLSEPHFDINFTQRGQRKLKIRSEKVIKFQYLWSTDRGHLSPVSLIWTHWSTDDELWRLFFTCLCFHLFLHLVYQPGKPNKTWWLWQQGLSNLRLQQNFAHKGKILSSFMCP